MLGLCWGCVGGRISSISSRRAPSALEAPGLQVLHWENYASLAATLWTDWRMWTIDTDRNLSSGRLKVLSLRSGIREDFIWAATLAPTIGKTQHRPLSKNITWPWTLTIGARNTKRRNGLQYCPLCLTGDASPYFRINWRLAWHTGCERHQCALLDRCWYCQSPVEPHRLTELSSSAAVCSSCNKALAEGPQSKG